MAENNVTTLNGWFKEVYADNVEDLVPETAMIHNDLPYVERSARNGAQYHQPVVLTHEHGFTYAGAGAGAFDLEAAIAAIHDEALLTGTQLTLESQLDYESCARASDSKRSFGRVTAHVIENMMRSFHKRLEILYLYGGATPRWGGVCRIHSQTDDSGTTQTYTVYPETFAPGILSGLEGAIVDLYDDDGTAEAPSTLLSTAGSITVTAVSFTSPTTATITLTGTEAELDLATSPDGTACYLYFNTAFGNEMTGLTGIARNTGTLFSVAGGTYGQWQGNTQTLSGALTFGQVLEGFDGPAGRGGLDGQACAYVPIRSWTHLAQDEAALKRHGGSSSKLKNGARALEFMGQGGVIQVKPYSMIKQGMWLGLPKDGPKRLGATEMTFNVPGMEEEKFLYQLPTKAGLGVRAYANQAVFCPRPAQCVIGEGIS